MRALGNDNIRPETIRLGLSTSNRANVFRLMNDQRTVRYFVEVYLDAWELDPPDSQVGGSLCIRINRAGGRYIPGCLMCKRGALKTYLPSECSGVFSKEMLENAFGDGRQAKPMLFAGQGMRIKLLIEKLRFSDHPSPSSREPKVSELQILMEFIPDASVSMEKRFVRVQ